MGKPKKDKRIKPFLTAEVTLLDTDVFQESLHIIKDVALDEEIPLHVRDKYRYRIEGLFELVGEPNE